jgi:hypothetical protein
MRRYVNLMSDAARFRTTARLVVRRWALALVATATLLTPLAGIHWQESRQVRQLHEAREASYEPIRRLNMMNMDLRTKAAALVRDERLPLELSRKRPVATVLGVVSAAAASSEGALFIEHLQVVQSPPAGPNVAPAPDRLVIEAACTLKYDVTNFVDALKVPPISDARITSDEVVTENGVDRKNFTVECVLNAAASPETPHVN